MSFLASSSAILVSLAVMLGIVSLGWFLLFREEGGAEGTRTLDDLGFRPEEHVHAYAVGQVLFADEHLIAGGGAKDDPSFVETMITTDDRLLVVVRGQITWFESHQRPRLRPVGRIMLEDKTSLLGMITGATETVVSFVPDGSPSPAGAQPKQLVTPEGAVEDVYVLELKVPMRPPLRFEAVRSAAMMLCQWSRARALPITSIAPGRLPAPPGVPCEDTLQSHHRVIAVRPVSSKRPLTAA